MNEYDSKRIYDFVEAIGYKKTENVEQADCHVLNTCHIREKATDKVYHHVGRIKKKFRNKKKPIVIITGCVAQAEGDLILEKEKYIDAVIGPQSYHKFNETLLKIEKDKTKLNFTDFNTIDKFDKLSQNKNSNSNVSSFLTIQEGCDKFCNFCVVPYTRGAEFSRSFDEIISESNDLANNGVKEITLLGQNVNAYNFEGKKLSNLIREIEKIKKIDRIRYTTSHPVDFSEDLIEAHASSKKLMPLIHLPVQSGSNKILKSMNRKHTVEDYLNLIDKILKANPLIKFSSDFIIGYPGETEQDFQDTLNLLRKVKYINSYSFNFSARPGTPAFEMKQTESSVAKERLIIFQEISEKIKLDYRQNILNNKSTVLFENRIKNGKNFFGRDEYFNAVIVESKKDLKGNIKRVKIIDGNQNSFKGKIVSEVDNQIIAA